MSARRVQDVVKILGLAFDLSENGIERMLQRTIDGVALSGSQLLQIGVDALASLITMLAVTASEVSEHLLAFEDGLGDVIQNGTRGDYNMGSRLRALGFS
jgi:hypothetical protein